MSIVDARGLVCPEPVILTKKEVDAGQLLITIIVDNDTAKQNVIKLGTKLEYDISTETKSDGIYVTLKKSGNENIEEEIKEAYCEKANTKCGYLITTDKLGKGADDLGK